eukprot:15455554-Alexandrium_andersonii.AAC.1
MGLQAVASYSGVEVTFPFNKCIRQGNVDSSLLFQALLMHAVSHLIQAWSERGFGVDIEDSRRLTTLLWADNFWLFAESRETLTIMTSELIDRLKEVGLTLKPDALCFLTTSKDDDSSIPLSVPLSPSVAPETTVFGPAVPVSESVEGGLAWRDLL